jgi:hypothetical protein
MPVVTTRHPPLTPDTSARASLRARTRRADEAKFAHTSWSPQPHPASSPDDPNTRDLDAQQQQSAITTINNQQQPTITIQDQQSTSPKMYKYQQLQQPTLNEQVLFNVLDSVLKERQQSGASSCASSASTSSSSSSSGIHPHRIPCKPTTSRRSSNRKSTPQQNATTNPAIRVSSHTMLEDDDDERNPEDYTVSPVPSLIAHAATGSSTQADKKQTAFAQELAAQLEQHSWDALEWDVFVDTDVRATNSSSSRRRGSTSSGQRKKSKRRASTTAAQPSATSHVAKLLLSHPKRERRIGANQLDMTRGNNRRISQSYTALNTMWLMSAEDNPSAATTTTPIDWTPLLPITSSDQRRSNSPDALALLESFQRLGLEQR